MRLISNVPIKDILIIDRARRNYEEIVELSISITEDGLINPVTLKSTPNEPQPYRLLAGGSRMKALELLEWTEVPARVYDRNLSILEMKRIELQENLRRKNLPYPDEVRLKRDVADLELEIKGKRTGSSIGPGTSDRTIAKEILDISPANLSRARFLADAIDLYPELGQCKTENEAHKKLKKMSETIQREQIASDMVKKQESTPIGKIHSNLTNAYILKDFFEHVKTLQPESIDICEIDPPYGINLHGTKKNMSSDEGYTEVDQTSYLDFLAKLSIECYRVMKPDSWLILWFAPDPWFELIFNIFTRMKFPGEEEPMFKGMRLPGLWAKQGDSQTMNPHLYLANSYEMFFYFRKGNPKIRKPGRSNIYNYRRIAGQKKRHPTERPIELIEDVLSTFGGPGDSVLVPFLGSGNTLLASSNLMMDAHGCELAKEYKDSYIIKVHSSTPGKYKNFKEATV